jgi:hypothetical protein
MVVDIEPLKTRGRRKIVLVNCDTPIANFVAFCRAEERPFPPDLICARTSVNKKSDASFFAFIYPPGSDLIKKFIKDLYTNSPVPFKLSVYSENHSVSLQTAKELEKKANTDEHVFSVLND